MVESSCLDARQALCPVCDQDADRTSVLQVQTAPPVRFVRCSHCQAVSAERFPSEHFISALYDPSHYSSSLVSSRSISQRCARRILATIPYPSDSQFRILDYGGNDGTLSKELRTELQRGGYGGDISITVADIHPSRDHDGMRFVHPDELDPERMRFDLIIASAVLEHIPHIKPVLKTLAACAADDAYFYARTPYEIPLARVVPGYKLKWPRHLHDLGPDFWDRAPESLGLNLRIVMSRTSPVETTLKRAPAFTILAHLLKLPSLFETTFLRPALGYGGYLWRLVGGWEVVGQFTADTHH